MTTGSLALGLLLTAGAVLPHVEGAGTMQPRRPDADVPLAASGRAPCAATASLDDLPMIERPASRSGGRTLVVLLTGDGGWASLVDQLARTLADSGIAVVGLDARAYLSQARTPDETACDVARVLRHYLPLWRRDSIVLVGYSRGADLAPFVANRLPPDLAARVALVALLGPAERASFQFRWSDLVRTTPRASALPALPEWVRLHGTGVRMLCVYGTDESASLCRAADPGLATKIALRGGHHFDGDYPALAHLILGVLRR